jgi:hypothetical protein
MHCDPRDFTFRPLSSNRAQRPQTACGLFFVARFGLLRLRFEIFFDGFTVAFGLGGPGVLIGGATGIGLQRLVLLCHMYERCSAEL